MSSVDPLGSLAALPDVAEAAAKARAEVDRLLWHRKIRNRTAEFAAESALRGAVANADMEGAAARLESVRSGGALDDSPMGRVLAGSLRLSAEIPTLVDLIGTAPRQVLARMHAVVAAGLVPDDQLGRPRAEGQQPDDPLRLGAAPGPAEVAERLDGMAELLSTPSESPAVVLAAIVSAEMASMRPFGWGSGLVARALPRLVLAARGVDPGMLAMPEAGLMTLGRPAYVSHIRGYATGSPAGVSSWIVHCAESVRLGALASAELAEAVA